MINFPESPEIDDTYSAGGRTWKWSGSRWLAVNGTVSVAPGGGVTSYNQLTDTPTLGTAAATAASDYATAAQGAIADSALQASALTPYRTSAAQDTIDASKAALSHAHGNITNAGAIGTTSGVPIITGASGVLQAGSFGATAETFCRGNDSRLADSRQPTLHKSTHAIGGSDVVTPNSIGAAAMGILLDGKFVQYSGIKNGRVSYYSLVSGGIGQENADVSWTGTEWALRYLHPTGHATVSYHGSLTDTDYPWQAFANIKPALNPQAQHTHPLSQLEQSAATNGQVPTWNGTAWVPATPAALTYTHPTTDGNLHVPATSTTNNGKVLKAGATAGSLSWGTLTATDVGGVSNGGGAAAIMVLTSAQYSAIPAGSIDNNTIYIII